MACSQKSEKNVNSGVKELKPSFRLTAQGTRRSRGRCGERMGFLMGISKQLLLGIYKVDTYREFALFSYGSDESCCKLILNSQS
jgi:hypothetical protein